MSRLPNATPVVLPGPAGPAHRPCGPARTSCGRNHAGMKAVSLVAVAVFGVPFCDRCWPEVALSPGWPLSIKRSHNRQSLTAMGQPATGGRL